VYELLPDGVAGGATAGGVVVVAGGAVDVSLAGGAVVSPGGGDASGSKLAMSAFQWYPGGALLGALDPGSHAVPPPTCEPSGLVGIGLVASGVVAAGAGSAASFPYAAAPA
jgi:hypothetical protein